MTKCITSRNFSKTSQVDILGTTIAAKVIITLGNEYYFLNYSSHNIYQNTL